MCLWRTETQSWRQPVFWELYLKESISDQKFDYTYMHYAKSLTYLINNYV